MKMKKIMSSLLATVVALSATCGTLPQQLSAYSYASAEEISSTWEADFRLDESTGILSWDACPDLGDDIYNIVYTFEDGHSWSTSLGTIPEAQIVPMDIVFRNYDVIDDYLYSGTMEISVMTTGDSESFDTYQYIYDGMDENEDIPQIASFAVSGASLSWSEIDGAIGYLLSFPVGDAEHKNYTYTNEEPSGWWQAVLNESNAETGEYEFYVAPVDANGDHGTFSAFSLSYTAPAECAPSEEQMFFDVKKDSNGDLGAGILVDLPLDGVTPGTTTYGELREMYGGIRLTGSGVNGCSDSRLTADDFVTKAFIQVGDGWTWYDSNSLVLNFNDIFNDSDVVQKLGYQIYIRPEAIEEAGLAEGDNIFVNTDDRNDVAVVEYNGEEFGGFLKHNGGGSYSLEGCNYAVIPEGVTIGKTTVGELREMYSGILLDNMVIENIAGCEVYESDLSYWVVVQCGADPNDYSVWTSSPANSYYYDFSLLEDVPDEYLIKNLHLSFMTWGDLSGRDVEDGDVVFINTDNVERTGLDCDLSDVTLNGYAYAGSTEGNVSFDVCEMVQFDNGIDYGTDTFGELRSQYTHFNYTNWDKLYVNGTAIPAENYSLAFHANLSHEDLGDYGSASSYSGGGGVPWLLTESQCGAYNDADGILVTYKLNDEAVLNGVFVTVTVNDLAIEGVSEGDQVTLTFGASSEAPEIDTWNPAFSYNADTGVLTFNNYDTDPDYTGSALDRRYQLYANGEHFASAFTYSYQETVSVNLIGNLVTHNLFDLEAQIMGDDIMITVDAVSADDWTDSYPIATASESYSFSYTGVETNDELGVPSSVEVNDYGFVTWSEVEGAIGYVYTIADGELITYYFTDSNSDYGAVRSIGKDMEEFSGVTVCAVDINGHISAFSENYVIDLVEKWDSNITFSETNGRLFWDAYEYDSDKEIVYKVYTGNNIELNQTSNVNTDQHINVYLGAAAIGMTVYSDNVVIDGLLAGDNTITVKAGYNNDNGEFVVLAEATDSFVYNFDGTHINSDIPTTSNVVLGDNDYIYWDSVDGIEDIYLIMDAQTESWSKWSFRSGGTCDWGLSKICADSFGSDTIKLTFYSIDINGDVSEPFTQEISFGLPLWESGVVYDEETGKLSWDAYDGGNDVQYAVYANDIQLGVFNSTTTTYELPVLLAFNSINDRDRFDGANTVKVAAGAYDENYHFVAEVKPTDSFTFIYDGCDTDADLAAPVFAYMSDYDQVCWDDVYGAAAYIVFANAGDGDWSAWSNTGCDWGVSKMCMDSTGADTVNVTIYTINADGDVSEPYTTTFPTEMGEWDANFTLDEETGVLSWDAYTLEEGVDYKYSIYINDALFHIGDANECTYVPLATLIAMSSINDRDKYAGDNIITVKAGATDKDNRFTAMASSTDSFTYYYDGCDTNPDLASTDYAYLAANDQIWWNPVEGAAGYYMAAGEYWSSCGIYPCDWGIGMMCLDYSYNMDAVEVTIYAIDKNGDVSEPYVKTFDGSLPEWDANFSLEEDTNLLSWDAYTDEGLTNTVYYRLVVDGQSIAYDGDYTREYIAAHLARLHMEGTDLSGDLDIIIEAMLHDEFGNLNKVAQSDSAFAFYYDGCDTVSTLASPANPVFDSEGMLSFDAVEGALAYIYIIKTDDGEHRSMYWGETRDYGLTKSVLEQEEDGVIEVNVYAVNGDGDISVPFSQNLSEDGFSIIPKWTDNGDGSYSYTEDDTAITENNGANPWIAPSGNVEDYMAVKAISFDLTVTNGTACVYTGYMFGETWAQVGGPVKNGTNTFEWNLPGTIYDDVRFYIETIDANATVTISNVRYLTEAFELPEPHMWHDNGDGSYSYYKDSTWDTPDEWGTLVLPYDGELSDIQSFGFTLCIGYDQGGIDVNMGYQNDEGKDYTWYYGGQHNEEVRIVRYVYGKATELPSFDISWLSPNAVITISDIEVSSEPAPINAAIGWGVFKDEALIFDDSGRKYELYTSWLADGFPGDKATLRIHFKDIGEDGQLKMSLISEADSVWSELKSWTIDSTTAYVDYEIDEELYAKLMADHHLGFEGYDVTVWYMDLIPPVMGDYNFRFENGTFTWDEYDGAIGYKVSVYDGITDISDECENTSTENMFSLMKENGFVKDTYVFRLYAIIDEDSDVLIGRIEVEYDPDNICKHTETKWCYDDDKHWNICEKCEMIIEGSEASHEMDEGTETVTATNFIEGVITYSCTAGCGFSVEESIDKLPINAKAGIEQVLISWNKQEGAVKYRVYSYMGGKYTHLGDTTSTEYIAIELTAGITYGFLVRAYVDGVWTTFSVNDVVYATPTASTKPVVVATAGEGKVTLSWNAISGATKYRVFTYMNGKYATLGDTSATEYVADGLTAGTKYGFLVRAYANKVWSEFSAADVVYATPKASTKPVVTAIAGENKVMLSWDKISGATQYRVFTYMGGKYAILGDTSEASYDAEGLVAGTEYGFLVRALVNGAWSAFSVNDVVYATPIATTKPVVSAVAGNGKVTLAWDVISGATNYRVFTYLNGKYAVLGETKNTSFEATGLTAGKIYGFLVRALVNGVWSTFSVNDVVYATPTASTRPVVTAMAGVGKVMLSWDKVSGAANYRVFTYLDGKYAVLGETKDTSYDAEGLVAGVNYGFLVRAYVNGAWSTFSVNDVVYATPTASTRPVVTAMAGVGKVMLSWDKVSGATNYRVFTYLDGKYAVLGETKDTSYDAEGLVAGVNYGFLVRAYVNGAWSAFSVNDVVYATPASATKPVVTAMAGTAKVMLSWDKVSGATNYRVFTYLNGKYAILGDTTDTSYDAEGLVAGVNYGFLVRAYVNGAWTAFSVNDVVYATPAAATKPVVTAMAGSGKVYLSWNAVAGATNYRVFSYLNGKYALLSETAATSYTAEALTSDVEYGFLVRAYVNGAWTTFSTADLAYATP